MSRPVLALLFAAVLALFAGCDAPSLPPPTSAPTATLSAAHAGAAEVRVDETRDGGEVALSRGQRLVIELPATAGTGYGWTLTALPDHLALISQGEAAGAAPGDGVGRPTRHRIVVEARQTGSGRLTAAYRRPWETGKPPERTFSLLVVVK